MLEQDNNFYLIIFSILIICLLDNVGYYREKLHVNHFRQYKAQRVAMLYLNVCDAHYCYDRCV